ncbi:hypothetical protein OGATHE_000478 [Ogataea polymorpha]|uniref:Uncharacterized protein n=1 Tax=Ogataea polymorpha TaxID=460523 RepID=A0A9P8TGE7_9ASCO|nr:hypothetical protein OGATHE_000478 [Ogataea polymorpha]
MTKFSSKSASSELRTLFNALISSITTEFGRFRIFWYSSILTFVNTCFSGSMMNLTCFSRSAFVNITSWGFPCFRGSTLSSVATLPARGPIFLNSTPTSPLLDCPELRLRPKLPAISGMPIFMGCASPSSEERRLSEMPPTLPCRLRSPKGPAAAPGPKEERRLWLLSGVFNPVTDGRLRLPSETTDALRGFANTSEFRSPLSSLWSSIADVSCVVLLAVSCGLFCVDTGVGSCCLLVLTDRDRLRCVSFGVNRVPDLLTSVNSEHANVIDIAALGPEILLQLDLLDTLNADAGVDVALDDLLGDVHAATNSSVVVWSHTVVAGQLVDLNLAELADVPDPLASERLEVVSDAVGPILEIEHTGERFVQKRADRRDVPAPGLGGKRVDHRLEAHVDLARANQLSDVRRV